MKKKSRKKLYIAIFLLIALGFSLYFRDDIMKVLSGLVYFVIFGAMSVFTSKKDKETRKNYVDAMRENDKAIKDAVKLAEDIQKSKVDHLKEMNKSVEKAKERVGNMSDTELVNWGNKFLSSRS